MNVVYHAHYLAYFEDGRTELMRSLGGTYRRLEDDGTQLMVVETGVRHHAPAAYDDVLTIRTYLTSVRTVRMQFDYEVFRDDKLLATGFTVLASTDRTGRLRRLPDTFRRQVASIAADAPGKTDARSAVQGA